MSLPSFVDNVIPYACQWLADGSRVALITLVGVDGSSPRPVGSQVAVREDGEFVGLISGGCVEAALVHEARAAMAEGKNRLLRYGKGSPYFDIQLPCGSGIDILIDVTFDGDVLMSLQQFQLAREPVMLCIKLQEALNNESGYLHLEPYSGRQNPQKNSDAGTFVRYYPPTARLLAFGRGEIFQQVITLAPAIGFEVIAVSPDKPNELARLQTLANPTHFDPTWCDAWTAAALLFHDHEWEGPILQNLLASDCFYIGALGSQRSQKLRQDWLTAHGVGQEKIGRIKGPIGLDIGSRTPPEIAISILAEIISWRR